MASPIDLIWDCVKQIPIDSRMIVNALGACDMLEFNNPVRIVEINRNVGTDEG